MTSVDEPYSLAALYLRNREAMLRAARAILRNQYDAEDAVSAAVVKVAARLAGGHAPDEPDGYLIQAARNAALDHLRAAARHGQRLNDPLGSRLKPALPGNPQPMADIVDLIIERQRSIEIRTAVQGTIEGLAKREGTMLALLLDGRTRADIGAHFNLSGQRVGQLLKKPIADLLTQLGIEPAGRRRQRPAGD